MLESRECTAENLKCDLVIELIEFCVHRLLVVLRRDGILYFGAIFAANLMNVLIYLVRFLSCVSVCTRTYRDF